MLSSGRPAKHATTGVQIMSIRSFFVTCAALMSLSLVNSFGSASAEEYVWARTGWGASNVNGRYGSVSNGYGGYWVPKNAAGNNYESQGNFRNSGGYIIPSNAQSYDRPSRPGLFPLLRRHR